MNKSEWRYLEEDERETYNPIVGDYWTSNNTYRRLSQVGCGMPVNGLQRATALGATDKGILWAGSLAAVHLSATNCSKNVVKRGFEDGKSL